jgi:membrane-bound metal-dependent hydrolase YbcI (DUF457 family)
MDTLSHTFWGYGLYGKRGHPWLATIFGAMPDLLSFGLLMIMRIGQDHPRGKPRLEGLPDWLFTNYNITHSLIIAAVVIFIVYRFRKDWAFAMLAWPFHILLDMPFHTKAFFPTPFLWPVSDFVIDGIPWSRPFVWYPNIAGVVILLAWRWHNGRQAKLTPAPVAVVQQSDAVDGNK